MFEAWRSLIHFVQWNYLFVARKRSQLWRMKFIGSSSSNLIQQLSIGDWDQIWMDITDTNTSSCFFWGFGLRSQTWIVSDASSIDTILYTYQKSDFEYSDLETVWILNVQIHIQISHLVFEPFSNGHLEISVCFHPYWRVSTLLNLTYKQQKYSMPPYVF
jgi:hypothetical protein